MEIIEIQFHLKRRLEVFPLDIFAPLTWNEVSEYFHGPTAPCRQSATLLRSSSRPRRGQQSPNQQDVLSALAKERKENCFPNSNLRWTCGGSSEVDDGTEGILSFARLENYSRLLGKNKLPLVKKREDRTLEPNLSSGLGAGELSL